MALLLGASLVVAACTDSGGETAEPATTRERNQTDSPFCQQARHAADQAATAFPEMSSALTAITVTDPGTTVGPAQYDTFTQARRDFVAAAESLAAVLQAPPVEIQSDAAAVVVGLRQHIEAVSADPPKLARLGPATFGSDDRVRAYLGSTCEVEIDRLVPTYREAPGAS